MFEFYFQRQGWRAIKMHVTKLNVQKKKKKKKKKISEWKNPNSTPILECQAKLSTSVLNTSAHIKTPIMSRIVTKPTEWQVLLAIAAELNDLTIPQTDGLFVRLLDIMVGYSERILTRWTVMFFILITKTLLNYYTNCEKIIS